MDEKHSIYIIDSSKVSLKLDVWTLWVMFLPSTINKQSQSKWIIIIYRSFLFMLNLTSLIGKWIAMLTISKSLEFSPIVLNYMWSFWKELVNILDIQ